MNVNIFDIVFLALVVTFEPCRQVDILFQIVYLKPIFKYKQYPFNRSWFTSTSGKAVLCGRHRLLVSKFFVIHFYIEVHFRA
jgi:hypothetical protein